MGLFTKTPKIETRNQSNYSDILVDLIVAQSQGINAKATSTAAVEIASGIIARAFASADVNGPPAVVAALSPAVLHGIGRQLVRRGETVLHIRPQPDMTLELLAASDWDVQGDPSPTSWRYRINLAGPSDWTTTVRVPGRDVIHSMWSCDPSRPWRGVSPIESASLAGTLSAEVSALLVDEAKAPRGQLLPQPSGDSAQLEALAADLTGAKGSTLLVESQQQDWQRGGTGPANDWQPVRFGMRTPAEIVALAAQALEEVLAACGIAPALLGNSDGTSKRESYRQLLHNTIAPQGRMLAAELSAKFDTTITLDWAELRAGDITGKSRAFQSMVGSGMDLTQAAALSGLLVEGQPVEPAETPASTTNQTTTV